MSSVRQSIVLSALERYGNLALTLVSIVVLSRLLAPNEFGILSIASSIYCIIAARKSSRDDLARKCVSPSLT